mgnify:CR=1 FL=1
MTKDEFWEAINTGGKVYTYDAINPYIGAFTGDLYTHPPVYIEVQCPITTKSIPITFK